MGIYDRDYYREATRQSRIGTGLTPVCKWLVAINVVVFLLQLFTQAPAPRERDIIEQLQIRALDQDPGAREKSVTDWLQLDSETIRGLEIWRLVTYGFCHSPNNLFHIIFNMLFLWWFGRALEEIYGSREFLRFYLTAIVLSGIGILALNAFIDRSVPAIGASGGVAAIMMLYATYYPRQQLLLFFVIPIEIRWLVVGYAIYETWPVLMTLAESAPMDGVAHEGHLAGFAYGFLYRKLNLRYDQFLKGFGGPRLRNPLASKPQVRIYREPPASPTVEQGDLEKRVDAILAKIQKHGENSLTDDERAALVKASQRYRDRRR